MAGVDVLLVSLGTTAGLREADRDLAGSLERAGATVAVEEVARVRRLRTFALTDLAQASAAARAAERGIALRRPRAIVYSTTTAALRRPAPGAIRFDAAAAGNRPGRHGAWQRPVERRRLRESPLLLPWSAEALAESGAPAANAVVVPVAAERSGPPAAERDLAAMTYASQPQKKGLDRVLAAWAAARRRGETLLVAGAPADARPAAEGVEYADLMAYADYRSLLRRTRLFITAPRREDYGISQLEALADGCMLVTTPSPGPYAALPIARGLDPRLVSDDLAPAIRAALDSPAPGYADRAAEALRPFAQAAIDRVVLDEVVPRLLGTRRLSPDSAPGRAS
ncbi:MAG: glycosyltransferase [Solirubrobacteraceae bacterium]